MEISGPCVVAEPAPLLHDGLGAGAGELLQRRKPGHESREVLQNTAHLRLLQHEFGNQDGIGIARVPPGEIARRFSVPRQKLVSKGFLPSRGGRSGHAYTRYTSMRAFTAALDLRRFVGRWTLRSASHAGRFSFMVLDLVRSVLEWRVWVPYTIRQTIAVGYGSLFIVMLVSGFAGAVTSLQTGYQFTGQLPLYVAGGVIVESMILELGPVLTGLILAGRIGARYAAELGSMRVTEQIDALESLGRSPVTHLLLPRILAGVIAHGLDLARRWFGKVREVEASLSTLSQPPRLPPSFQ